MKLFKIPIEEYECIDKELPKKEKKEILDLLKKSKITNIY